MITIAVALILAATPAPTDGPVCVDPGVPVEQCQHWQLPEEVIGRQIDGPDGVVYVVIGLDANGDPILATAHVPAPAPAAAVQIPDSGIRVLAHTGVPTGPYAAAAAGLIVAGAGLVLLRRRTID
jgi:uncharacterized protein (TIGR04145 family)